MAGPPPGLEFWVDPSEMLSMPDDESPSQLSAMTVSAEKKPRRIITNAATNRRTDSRRREGIVASTRYQKNVLLRRLVKARPAAAHKPYAMRIG